MIKPGDPRELAVDILERSTCRIQVGACIEDSHGIVCWGWNSAGQGFGMCAERATVRRANRDRLKGATIYVASKRKRNGRVVPSKPCPDCQAVIDANSMSVVWRDNDGKWVMD